MNPCLEMPCLLWFCPSFVNISMRHPVSSKLSTTLVRAYITLVQWAWNLLLLGRSFKGTSLNDLKYLWWLGYASKNLHKTNIPISKIMEGINQSVKWLLLNWTTRVCFLARSWIFSSLWHSDQAHPASCSVDAMGFSSVVKQLKWESDHSSCSRCGG
jgi:hypothetical protein